MNKDERNSDEYLFKSEILKEKKNNRSRRWYRKINVVHTQTSIKYIY